MSNDTDGSLDVQRELALAETFVTLADTLVDDYDVVELLDTLVRTTVDLLDVTAAGLLLDDQRGNLTVVAASSEQSHLLEVFQLQNDEGPCPDCLRTGTAIISPDLEQDRATWPRFVPVALQNGLRSVVAVPLRLRSEVIGALNMFGDRAEAMPPRDVRLAQALADVATIGILQRRSVHRSTLVAEQLQHALTSRIVIEQAKGVLAERRDLDMDASFALLRGHSRDANRKLTEVAQAVVRGELDIPAP